MNAELQIKALQTLVDELSAEVADLTEAVTSADAKRANEVQTSARIEQLIQVLSKRNEPVIQVNVSPTPIQNNMPQPLVQVIESSKSQITKAKVQYDGYGRVEVINFS